MVATARCSSVSTTTRLRASLRPRSARTRSAIEFATTTARRSREETTSVNATSDHCAGLCAKALNNVSVKVVEAAAAALKGAPASVVRFRCRRCDDLRRRRQTPPSTRAPPTPTITIQIEDAAAGRSGKARAHDLRRRTRRASAVRRGGETRRASRGAEANRRARSGRVRLLAEGVSRTIVISAERE